MDKKLACSIYNKAKLLQTTYRHRGDTLLHAIEVIISRMRLKQQISLPITEILPEMGILRICEGSTGVVPMLQLPLNEEEN